MKSPATFSSSLVELCAVFSICGILVFAEWQFGTLSTAAHAFTSLWPGSATHVAGLAAALWMGMAVYSFRRRQELVQEKKAREALQSDFEMANLSDRLTGLPNRDGLDAYLWQLAESLPYNRDVMLVGIFFSNLKTIADVQGLSAAGTTAEIVAHRLTERIRLPDFAACVNGEQFYLLLTDEERSVERRATLLIETLLADLRSIILPNGVTLPLSAHVGTVTLSRCPSAPGQPRASELIRRCDLATHEAAARGSGAIVPFDAALEKSIDQRAIIESTLDDAISHGEIIPYFQPLVSLAQNKVTGFEVLARWTHPAIGPIPPSVFIPIAAESGRLEAITVSLIGQACRAARAWEGDFKLAFNISPKMLNNERFMADFLSTLAESQFGLERVEIEITEDAFVKDASILSQPIKKLKDKGISLAIDDFGTGYSSLRHLQIMPFDKIKIDQSFVKDMSGNQESRKIVEAIIGLGRSMGLRTVAEGIEGEEHRLMLERLGCETGQGYLFSRPMPGEEVAAFLRQHRAVEARPEPIRLRA